LNQAQNFQYVLTGSVFALKVLGIFGEKQVMSTRYLRANYEMTPRRGYVVALL
jgi:hypothetical protein